MRSIILVTEKDVKATGKPAGSLIPYEDAPAYMQRRYDAEQKPVSAYMSERIEEQTACALEFARETREWAQRVSAKEA